MVITKIIKDVVEVGIFIKMELSMKAIGRMGTKRELVAISMVMEYIWESVI